jgi:DNA-binding transcriptional ArsR family regulator
VVVQGTVPVPGGAPHRVYSDRMASDRMGNSDVFAVIADKTRRAILTALKDGERSVGELVAELGVSQPTVSKHLKILREAGMVSMEAQGQRRLYAVAPEPLAAVTDWVQEVVGAGGTSGPAPAGPAADVGAGAPTGSRTGGTADDIADGAPDGTTGGPPARQVPAAPPVPLPPGPGPDPGTAADRPARGAGARAADLLSTLSGLRRRGRNARR